MDELLANILAIDTNNCFNWHIVGNEIHSNNILVTDELVAILLKIQEIANISSCADVYSDRFQFYVTK